MNFHDIKLFDWLQTMPQPEVNLTVSGVAAPVMLADLNIDLSDAPLYGANFYGYGPLRETIAKIHNTTPESVFIAGGASMANFLILSVLTQKIKKLVTEHPVYEPFVNVADTLTDGNIHYVPRLGASDFSIDLDAISALPAEPTVLLLSNPHNPSGHFDSAEKLRVVAEAIAENDGWVVVDEVFLPFLENWKSLVGNNVHERIITTGSLTKAWGLWPLRIGWIIAPPQFGKEIKTALNNMNVTQAFISEYLANEFLARPDLGETYLRNSRQISRDNLQIVRNALEIRSELNCCTPDAGISMWLRFKDGRDSQEFCDRLQKEKSTAVVPGHFFGDKNGFRLSFGLDQNLLKLGLNNIIEVLDSL